jgi:hypothetical protein
MTEDMQELTRTVHLKVIRVELKKSFEIMENGDRETIDKEIDNLSNMLINYKTTNPYVKIIIQKLLEILMMIAVENKLDKENSDTKRYINLISEQMNRWEV